MIYPLVDMVEDPHSQLKGNAFAWFLCCNADNLSYDCKDSVRHQSFPETCLQRANVKPVRRVTESVPEPDGEVPRAFPEAGVADGGTKVGKGRRGGGGTRKPG